VSKEALRDAEGREAQQRALATRIKVGAYTRPLLSST